MPQNRAVYLVAATKLVVKVQSVLTKMVDARARTSPTKEQKEPDFMVINVKIEIACGATGQDIQGNFVYRRKGVEVVTLLRRCIYRKLWLCLLLFILLYNISHIVVVTNVLRPVKSLHLMPYYLDMLLGVSGSGKN